MEQRNFILWIALSLTVLVGWLWLSSVLWPPQPVPSQQQAQQPQLNDDKKAADVKPAHLIAMVATEPGLTSPLFAIELARSLKLANQLVQQVHPEQPPKVQYPVKTVRLGESPEYYIQLLVTSKGAGIRELILPKFQAASWEGLPVYREDGTPAPLALIPDDPLQPSFLMHHYPETDPDKAGRPYQPVDTLANRVWEMQEFADKDGSLNKVVFTTKGLPGYEHLTIRKIVAIPPRAYHVDLTVELEYSADAPASNDPLKFRYQLAGGHGMPIEGWWYTYNFRNAMIGMVDAGGTLYRDFQEAARISFRGGGDKVPEGARGQAAVQYAGPTTQIFASIIAPSPDQAEGINWKDILAYARPMLESNEKGCRIDDLDWDANKLYVTFTKENAPARIPLVMLPRVRERIAELKLEERLGEHPEVVVSVAEHFDDSGVPFYAATWIRWGTEPRPMLDDIGVRVISEPISLEPGRTVSHKFVLYHGPIKVTQLGVLTGEDRVVSPELISYYADTLQLATLTDYPSPGWIGTFSKTILWTDLLIAITKLMHWLFNLLYWLVPHEGLVIILLTVVVRGLMFPISRKQAQSMIKMQELAPKMKELQEKYKNDPQERTQAVMELYRKHNVNPLAGCLPLLLQLPIFIGLYLALQESIRFRLASLLWVRNMAAPDMLFYWGQGMPWLTSPDAQGSFLYLGPYFNLLPILAVGIMLVHQKLMTPPPADEQQEMQQKMMKYMMVFFGLMFYKIAAGLCIYFIASSLWGLAERKLLPKKKPLPGQQPPGQPPTDGKQAKLPRNRPPGNGKPSAGKGKSKDRGKGRKMEDETPLEKLKSIWADILKQAEKK